MAHFFTSSYSLSNFSLILSALLLICLLIALLICINSTPIANNNCLLVFAHPDDETMFFGPIIQNINPNLLFALCITSGNSEKLGKIRRKELERALDLLRVPSKHLFFLDKEEINFKDGFTHKWDTNLLSHSILEVLRRLNCQSVVTFDGSGVSGHPNHIACFDAMGSLLDSWDEAHPPPQIFVLESVSILRKYTSILDVIASYMDWRCYPSKKICVASPWMVFKAMQEHKSQLIWFRYLYLMFSSSGLDSPQASPDVPGEASECNYPAPLRKRKTVEQSILDTINKINSSPNVELAPFALSVDEVYKRIQKINQAKVLWEFKKDVQQILAQYEEWLVNQDHIKID